MPRLSLKTIAKGRGFKSGKHCRLGFAVGALCSISQQHGGEIVNSQQDGLIFDSAYPLARYETHTNRYDVRGVYTSVIRCHGSLPFG